VAQESVGILDMEPPCTKHILAQYRGVCPQWESLLFLSDCYVSLITCWSANVDAVGARLTLCGPRGVIRIMREVIDKAGLNQLLVPYQ
jgi:hypothetical protein